MTAHTSLASPSATPADTNAPLTSVRADGLEGVVVAHTALSDVDGERGRLVLGGHDVESLALRAGFEDALGLLLDGALPDATRRASIAAALGRARVRAFEGGAAGTHVTRAPGAMAALRAALSALTIPSGSLEDELVSLAGAAAVALAAHGRALRDLAPVAPSASRTHALDLLAMLEPERPLAAARARALDSYLVTVSDHGLNASTFTARVVASTGASLAAACVAGVGALEGPLHGGAPGPVLDMLDAIGTADAAEAWLEAELLAGRRIMGMGHRIYRVRDPRAAVLERAIERLVADGAITERLDLARAVERAARAALRERYPQRTLDTNVEFYTAVLLDAVGLPRELFAATFANGRLLGWGAHVAEQRRVGRLVRPQSVYVGPRLAEPPLGSTQR